MGILDNVETGVKQSARKLIIYGPAKIGKSTFCAAAPKPLLVRLEDRVDDIDCAKTPLLTKYQEVADLIKELAESTHDYKTLIIDPIGDLERLIHVHLCQKYGWKSITDDSKKETAFQNGYKIEAPKGWRTFCSNLDYLRKKRNMNIILIAHEAKSLEKPTDKESYDKLIPAINIHSVSVIERWADIIGHYGPDYLVDKDAKTKRGRAIGLDSRSLELDGRNPAILSGNSFHFGNITPVNLGNLKDIMKFLLEDNLTPGRDETKTKGKK